jgi:hypothetical protein
MNETSFARILLATACPGSPALWAGSFTRVCLRSLLVRHAGPEEPAPYSDTGASRRRPDESREPLTLGPGFHREPCIAAGVYPVLDAGLE